MVTIHFQPEEKHLDHQWYGLFIEEWKDQGTFHYKIGQSWSFDLQESEVEAIAQLCTKYQIRHLLQEAYSLYFKMKRAVNERSAYFDRRQWGEIEPKLKNLEKWLESSELDKAFVADNIEYIKVKPKASKLAIRYDGILLDFICKAVIEKYERERDLMKLYQHSVFAAINAIKEKKPNELRERERASEEALAYHIFKFFKSESGLNNSDIERFNAELMKLAGFIMPPDESDITANADDYMMNFRKWRSSYEKYLKEYGLII